MPPDPDPLSDGFERFHSSAFIELIGPMWVRRDEGPPTFRFLVEERHGNTHGLAHGGVLMTVADIVLAQGIRAVLPGPVRMSTAGMTIDFARPVPVGAWLEGRADIQRRASRTVFANCYLLNAGERAVRASGIYVMLGVDAR